MKEMISEVTKINSNTINVISKIILSSNEEALIAKLGKKFVNYFIKFCIFSNKAKIFTYKIDDKIVAYSIFFQKEKYLMEELKKIKFKIIFSILLSFNFVLLFNLILIFFGKDIIIKHKKNIKILKESPNLTYLAVKEEFRNKGIGKKFLLNIFNNHYKNQYISVETNTNKALNFYLNHMHFKEIGFRKRSKTNLYLMLKKIS